jgi:hypothetical protein
MYAVILAFASGAALASAPVQATPVELGDRWGCWHSGPCAANWPWLLIVSKAYVSDVCDLADDPEHPVPDIERG